jgi:hypothetical protein
MNDGTMHRLPSADWLAFGVGMGAMILHYVWPPLLALVVLAVFLPSALRELGLLRDADELTRGVMHRAGFHAMLALAALVFLNLVLPVVGLFKTNGSTATPFAADTLRKTVVWVFLISYLIQYWGARGGTVRVLLGVAVMTLSPLVVLLTPRGYPWPGTLVAVTVGTALVMVGLAALVRRWPRPGGGLLLAIFLAAAIVLARDMDDPRLAWGMVQVLVQAAIVFGATGAALLRDTGKGRVDL